MKKILIVEDDTCIREILIEVFESEGYLVRHGVNGFEAIESLQTDIPDLILTDVTMPLMDGLEFRQEVLKNPDWNSIPMIVMSARDHAENKLESLGISNFINKPLELGHLIETVRGLA